MRKSPLYIIFTTVFMDLIGFGLVIPLVALYGRKFGASAFELGCLGAAYSTMQFFFAPLWGRLSDRYGRRPILLMSLAGSTLSYLAFAYAPGLWLLIASRAFAGIFAANISTAQAFVADVTSPKERARGMGLIGAAFGLGFLLGPGLAILALHFFPERLEGPGLLAASICGANFVLACFRLPESLTPELRRQAARLERGRNPVLAVIRALAHPRLAPLFGMYFLFTFCMANMEQVFSVFFEARFGMSTAEAVRATGKILVWAGLLGVLVQGGLVRPLVKRLGEWKVSVTGLAFLVPGAAGLAFGPSHSSYYLLILPIAIGSGLLTPSLSSMVSRSAAADEQGSTLGLSQSLGSLARALGPFFGLLVFHYHPAMPFFVASLSALAVFILALTSGRRFKTL